MPLDFFTLQILRRMENEQEKQPQELTPHTEIKNAKIEQHHCVVVTGGSHNTYHIHYDKHGTMNVETEPAAGDMQQPMEVSAVEVTDSRKEAFIKDMKVLLYQHSWDFLGALYDDAVALEDKRFIPALVARYIGDGKLRFRDVNGKNKPCFEVMTRHELYQQGISTWNSKI